MIPAKINNYKVNKPIVAKSLNIYPEYRSARECEDIQSTVNGKVADEKLVHEPKEVVIPMPIPVIEMTSGAKKPSRGTKRK